MSVYGQGNITMKRKWRGKHGTCLVNSTVCFKFPLAGTRMEEVTLLALLFRQCSRLQIGGKKGRTSNVSEKHALLQSTVPQARE